MELAVAFAVAVGALAQLAALLMALYTVGTAFLGHRYWKAAASDRVESMDGFYKDLSIVGGFLLLVVTGPGRYSIDAWYCLAAP
ncbi:MAG TPA: DoxX family protein [Burkholderiales bacterium]|nr:DoxX family protein [Burkholderiales bacterium]